MGDAEWGREMRDGPTLCDIQTMVGCLHTLLEVVYEASTEIQYLRPDGSRDANAERLNCLIILARDEAERIDDAVERCNSTGRAWL